VTLEELTDELYAHPPAAFVARRDELAREARTAGDKDLAARVKALRRPTVGAWYLNAAARSDLTSLRELLNLGRDLRGAQTAGDFVALRTLAVKRNPLVARVVHDIAAHLATLGVSATTSGLDEVRATLASVLADPEVADLVERGRLDGPREYGGFGVAFPIPESAGSPAAGGDDAATADAADLWAAAARRQELAAAETAMAEATDRHRAAEALVETLAARLAELHDALAAAERDRDQAEAALVAAEHRLAQAHQSF
jgi:hypothetical protein